MDTAEAIEAALYTLAARQSLLADLGMEALAQTSLQALLDQTVIALRASLEVDACFVLEQATSERLFVLRATAGVAAPSEGEPALDARARSQAGFTLLASEPVIVDDIRTERRFSVPDVPGERAHLSSMTVVIPGKTRPFGVLGAQQKRARTFTREEVDYLQAAANLIALAAERLQKEEELRRSEESFRSLIEHAPEGVMLRREETIVYVNDALTTYLGYDSEDDLLRRSVRDLVHSEDLSLLGPRGSPRKDAAIGYRPAEVRLIRRDGTIAMVETAEVPIVFKGHPCIASLMRDVTERKKMEARLRQSERLTSLGILAAGVAHEINNPLMYVLGNIEFARQGVEKLSPTAPPAPPENALGELATFLQEAMEGGERVRRIVRDLRVFSRGGDDDSLSLLDVRKVTASTLNIARYQIQRRARLLVEDAGTPVVMANDSRLGQVLLNLLLNATHAIPEGEVSKHQITVRTFTGSSGHAVIEVSDTGSGISKEHMSKLFDPFFTTKPKGVGTGLGLWICHQIVSGLGGEITVDSEVGRGTVFRVYLPPAPIGDSDEAMVSGPPSIRPFSTAPAPTAPLGPRGRVLIIDDERFVANFCRRALEKEHDVEVSHTCKDALAHLQKGPAFDVILCDLMMPEMTGMELYDEISQRFPAAAPSVVFLTGGVLAPAARVFRDQVSNLFLDKPCSPAILKETVRSRVNAARAASSGGTGSTD